MPIERTAANLRRRVVGRDVNVIPPPSPSFPPPPPTSSSSSSPPPQIATIVADSNEGKRTRPKIQMFVLEGNVRCPKETRKNNTDDVRKAGRASADSKPDEGT